MDTKGPIYPASEQNYYIYNVLTVSVNTLSLYQFQKRISLCCMFIIARLDIKNGRLHFLMIDRGTEYFRTENINCCTLLNIRHSLRTSHDPWTKRLVEARNKNFGTHQRKFFPNHALFNYNSLFKLTMFNHCQIYMFHHMK